MTRIAIRHTLSALAAVALATVIASAPTWAEQELEYLKQEKWGATNKPQEPKRNVAPTTNLKSSPSTPCDCSNCSAPYCHEFKDVPDSPY